MFEDVPRVSVQLSNLCNYQKLQSHAKCPASIAEEVQILSLKTIKSIVQDLHNEKWGKDRVLAFHVYNEPTLDPRLYWLIEYIVKQLPGVIIHLATNGWYLNESLIEELFDVGVKIIYVTTYNIETKKKIAPLVVQFPGLNCHIGSLTRLLMGYDDSPLFYKKCASPLCDLTIRSSGNVGLCCLDYEETVTFGNVNDESLLQIMLREYSKMKELKEELTHRIRNNRICKFCWSRRRYKLNIVNNMMGIKK